MITIDRAQDGRWTVDVRTATAISRYGVELPRDEAHVTHVRPNGSSIALALPRREDEDDEQSVKRAALIAAKVESML